MGYVFKEPPQPILTPEYLAKLDSIPSTFLPSHIRTPRALLQTLLNNQAVTLHSNTDSTTFTFDPPPTSEPGRKLVILGDTSDASGVEELAVDASLLVHESTNAYLPPSVDPKGSKKSSQLNERNNIYKT